jgi:hypothetical protein
MIPEQFRQRNASDEGAVIIPGDGSPPCRMASEPLTDADQAIIDGIQASRPKLLPPLVTSGGDGLTDEFKNAGWDKIRDEIYRGRGA